ncbi:MAG: DUF1549 and DUF1553 domain-containing protein [Gemmataceae bacterium]
MRSGLILLLPLCCFLVGCDDRPDLPSDKPLPNPTVATDWAFKPVRPVAVPRVKDSAWPRNPIDAFVLAKLEAAGRSPAPPAPPVALLRRLHLDLTGLPPTVEEQEAFCRDSSPDAWERLVDRLLSSPAHGERYARHWLDVARYADTNGYERDADKPSVWRYRDRVIRAFNGDLPFDRFVLEQLAGDELDDADADTVLSTGFLRLGPWDDEPADPKADRFDQLDDIVSTTAEAFLGLTLACARCHNHKFEPLTMPDYYRLVAVFNPLERPRDGRKELDRPAAPRGRKFDTAPPGYFLEERSPKPPPTHLLRRGRADSPGAEVQPGVPAVLAPTQPAFLPPGEFTSRRRLSLARWVASRDNPLTARVIVNRVWMWHFGEGLVATPNDFGTRGSAPTHPELLDWLAGWFVDHGWSLKELHRLIVTSATYRVSKQIGTCLVGWSRHPLERLPRQRLDAETIRDSVLAVSGRLNRTMFGPGVRPPIPRAALEGHSDPNTVWKPDGEREASRRSVYIHVKRSLMLPMLEALDFCDTTRSSARRTITTVAPQALILFNGDFVNQQSAHLARRIAEEAGPSEGKRLDRAYRLVLGRPPRDEERAILREGLARYRDGGLSEEAAWVQVCRVLLNCNEFVYPD